MRNGTLEKYPLGDRLEARVNVGSGNLLILTNDLMLPGIAENVTIGAVYNSLLVGSGIAQGTLGNGWRTRAGIDVKLIEADDNSVTYVAPDGVVGVFSPSGSGYNSPGEFKATLAHNGSGWKLTEHESGKELFFDSGGVLDKTEDRNGNVTDFVHDSAGRMTRIISDRGPATARTAIVEYDSAGRLVRYQQNNTDSTPARAVGYGYTPQGDLAEIVYLSGRRVSFTYDANRRVERIVNARSAITTLTYDGQHRVTSLTRVTEPGGGAGATTRFTYPSSTQTLVADANTDLSRPVADVPHTTYTLNDNKRVTKAVDPAGNERSRTYTPFHDVASAIGGNGGVTSNAYGANGGQSLTQSSSATGAAISLAYANAPTETNPTGSFQPSSATDAQGNTSTFRYSGAGNRTSTADAMAAEATVDYNSDGTVKTSTDPGNGDNATRYGYDADKQLTTITPPTGNSLGTRRLTYDKYGRIKTADDGAGRTTSYDYSLEDRLIRISYSDGTTPVTYDYDGAGNLTTRTDASGATTYTYDPLNRLATRQSASGGGLLTYAYDPVGNLTTLTDARGTTRYVYNSRNLLTAMTTAAGTRYAFSYDADGRRTRTFFGTTSDNSTWTARTTTSYDSSGRVTRITTSRRTDPADLVFDVSYCYSRYISGQPCSTAKANDTGLRQWQMDNITGERSVYSYDRGNRLTQAATVKGKTYAYAYDSRGNRTSVTVDGSTTQTLGYNSANQITSSGHTYDGAGNPTRISGTTGDIGYTAAQQQTSIGTNTYAYAGSDQKELLTAPQQAFVYGREDQHGLPWLQSFTYQYASGGGVSGYVERDGLGTPLGVRLANADHFYVTDGLSSVVAILDTAGDTSASYTYDPYGTVLTATGNRAAHNPIRYTGGTQDTAGTGFVKLGTRWYNPSQGRFTQQDSLNVVGDPRKGNRYAYAACNPVNYTDPTGYDTSTNIGTTMAGVITGVLCESTIVLGAAALAAPTGGASVAAGIAMAGTPAAGPICVGVGAAVGFGLGQLTD